MFQGAPNTEIGRTRANMEAVQGVQKAYPAGAMKYPRRTFVGKAQLIANLDFRLAMLHVRVNRT